MTTQIETVKNAIGGRPTATEVFLYAFAAAQHKHTRLEDVFRELWQSGDGASIGRCQKLEFMFHAAHSVDHKVEELRRVATQNRISAIMITDATHYALTRDNVHFMEDVLVRVLQQL